MTFFLEESIQSLASELEMRPLVAHCHFGLGRLYQWTSKCSQSEEYLSATTAMYREMGMNYELEKLETQLEVFK